MHLQRTPYSLTLGFEMVFDDYSSCLCQSMGQVVEKRDDEVISEMTIDSRGSVRQSVLYSLRLFLN